MIIIKHIQENAENSSPTTLQKELYVLRIIINKST